MGICGSAYGMTKSLITLVTTFITLITTTVLSANFQHRSLSASASGSTLIPCEDYGAKMCFSCASDDARAEWSSAYEHALNRPGNFSSLCDDMKEGQSRMHVVGCMTSCVTLVEPQFIFGKW